ncbi:hypothetical protein PM082_022787 [Marasmius tenuissimus]|nr:hypothetical protein PM082_022787 [Marasmius tenuissimus]
MEAHIQSLVEPIVATSQRIRDQYGVHVFGYAIQTRRDANNMSVSCAWGPKGEYEQVQKAFGRNIREPIGEFEAMFKIIEMENAGHSLAIGRQHVQLQARQNGKDGNRAMVKIFYQEDCRQFSFDKDVPLDSFLRLAWKYRICIVDWPASVPFPETGKSVFKMSAEHAAKAVEPRERYIEAIVDGRTEEDFVVNPKHMRLIRWSDEQMKLDIDEADKVTIVIDDNGVTKHTAGESKIYGQGEFYDADATPKKKRGGRGRKRTATAAEKEKEKQEVHQAALDLKEGNQLEKQWMAVKPRLEADMARMDMEDGQRRRYYQGHSDDDDDDNYDNEPRYNYEQIFPSRGSQQLRHAAPDDQHDHDDKHSPAPQPVKRVPSSRPRSTSFDVDHTTPRRPVAKASSSRLRQADIEVHRDRSTDYSRPESSSVRRSVEDYSSSSYSRKRVHNEEQYEEEYRSRCTLSHASQSQVRKADPQGNKRARGDPAADKSDSRRASRTSNLPPSRRMGDGAELEPQISRSDRPAKRHRHAYSRSVSPAQDRDRGATQSSIRYAQDKVKGTIKGKEREPVHFDPEYRRSGHSDRRPTLPGVRSSAKPR